MDNLDKAGADWLEAAASSQKDLRQLLGNFLTGVTVVACHDETGRTRAFTANSFTSVSLDPPMVLVCVASAARSAGVFLTAREFSISILSDGQEEVSRHLASAGPVKEALLDQMEIDGVPFLREGLAVIHCGMEQVIEVGDHTLLVGLIRRHRTWGGRPLGYFRGAYLRPEIGTAKQQGAGAAA